MKTRKSSQRWSTAGLVLGVFLCAWVVPAQPIYLALSSEEDFLISGVSVKDHEVAQTNLAGSWAKVLTAMTDLLPPETDLDALDVKSATNVYFSLDSDATVGGTLFHDEEVIHWNGSTFSLWWNPYLPPETDLDALHVVDESPRAVLFSSDSDYYEAGLAGVVADEDIVLLQEDGQGGVVVTLVFDGSVQGVPPEMDLDALAVRTDTEWLLSFDSAGTIGSLEFDDADLIAWDPLAKVFGPVVWFDASAQGVPEEVNLNAADVESAILTPTPSPSPTGTTPPTPTPTSSQTPTATPTSSPTPSLTATPSPSPTTPTPSPSPTASPTASATPLPTTSPTPSPTTPPPTPTPTPSPTLSPSPTATLTPSPTGTLPPTPTVTASPTPTLSPTPTPGPAIDTDGDGYADWYEVVAGTDPLDADDHPTLGDVDGDGHADLVDALLLYRWLLGKLPSPTLTCPDVNYDGACDIQDAQILYQWCVRASGYEILPRP